MNSPNRPSFKTILAWPHCGQTSSRMTSGFFGVFVPAAIFRVVLHSGEALHPRNWPKCPRLSAMGFPQFSQGSGSVSADASPSFGASSLVISFVFLHSGYPEHAMNRPNWPHLMTIGLPHFSHTSSVGISCFLRFSMFLEARLRSFSNFL